MKSSSTVSLKTWLNDRSRSQPREAKSGPRWRLSERAHGRALLDAARVREDDRELGAQQQVAVDVVRVEVHVEHARAPVEEAAPPQRPHPLDPRQRAVLPVPFPSGTWCVPRALPVRSPTSVRLSSRYSSKDSRAMFARNGGVPYAVVFHLAKSRALVGVALRDHDRRALAVDAEDRVGRVDGGHARARLERVRRVRRVAGLGRPVGVDPAQLELGGAEHPVHLQQVARVGRREAAVVELLLQEERLAELVREELHRVLLDEVLLEEVALLVVRVARARSRRRRRFRREFLPAP